MKLECDAGLATRRELQLLEDEADLGRVWHVPISWSMIMIRRLAMINTLWTVDDLGIPSMKSIRKLQKIVQRERGKGGVLAIF